MPGAACQPSSGFRKAEKYRSSQHRKDAAKDKCPAPAIQAERGDRCQPPNQEGQDKRACGAKRNSDHQHRPPPGRRQYVGQIRGHERRISTQCQTRERPYRRQKRDIGRSRRERGGESNPHHEYDDGRTSSKSVSRPSSHKCTCYGTQINSRKQRGELVRSNIVRRRREDR